MTALKIRIDPVHKPRHIKALTRLSRASGLYPECPVLRGLKIEGDPVSVGAFGEVYKVNFEGHEIAVKVLKIYDPFNMDKILQV